MLKSVDRHDFFHHSKHTAHKFHESEIFTSFGVLKPSPTLRCRRLDFCFLPWNLMFRLRFTPCCFWKARSTCRKVN